MSNVAFSFPSVILGPGPPCRISCSNPAHAGPLLDCLFPAILQSPALAKTWYAMSIDAEMNIARMSARFIANRFDGMGLFRLPERFSRHGDALFPISRWFLGGWKWCRDIARRACWGYRVPGLLAEWMLDGTVHTVGIEYHSVGKVGWGEPGSKSSNTRFEWIRAAKRTMLTSSEPVGRHSNRRARLFASS